RQRQQPFEDLTALRREIGEAERLAQDTELLVAGLEPRSVGDECLGDSAELVGNETQCGFRNDLARSQQPARIAQRAQLQREAELVVAAAAPADDGEIVVAECPVPYQVGFGHGQGKQALELRFGERAPSWHGGLSQLRYSLFATAQGSAGTRACGSPN